LKWNDSTSRFPAVAVALAIAIDIPVVIAVIVLIAMAIDIPVFIAVIVLIAMAIDIDRGKTHIDLSLDSGSPGLACGCAMCFSIGSFPPAPEIQGSRSAGDGQGTAQNSGNRPGIPGRAKAQTHVAPGKRA